MNILFLSRWFPYPPNNGSKLRIYNLLQGLGQHHEITLLSFADQPNVDPRTPELQVLCREIQVVPWKLFDPTSLRARLAFLSSTPRSMVDTYSLEMKRHITQLLSTRKYDAVIATEIDMAIYSKYFCRLPAVLDELQISVPYERFTQARSFGERFRYGLTWFKQRRYLKYTLKNFNACTVVSPQEHRLVSQAINGDKLIEVIPNCVDLASYKEFQQEAPQPNSLIFTGSFSFSPNYQAMVWFVKRAYPHIKAQIPDVHLSITGNHANRPLPSTDNITLTGFVDDVRPLIARSWVSVVPIHTGGGTRLKILEAMALRTPVVATSKGAEGLDAQPDKHLLIADTPEAFARQVARLLKESELRQYLADNAYQLIREKYDWAIVMPRFLTLLERITAEKSTNGF